MALIAKIELPARETRAAVVLGAAAVWRRALAEPSVPERIAMRKVAVFGNAGGGKSTLARRLAEITGLPLYIVDLIQFPGGRYRPEEKDGGKIPHEEYLKIHEEIIGRDRWIIDGFESVALAWERFAVADTLVHVDLPMLSHYWGITKRFARRASSAIRKAGRRTLRCGRARSTATGWSGAAIAD